MARWVTFSQRYYQDSLNNFYASLARYIAGSKRDIKAAMYTQYRGVVRNIFNVTPPMYSGEYDFPGSKVDWNKGRQQGLARIRESMSNVFLVLNQKQEAALARAGAVNRLTAETREPLSWYLSIQPENKRQKSLPVDQKFAINRSKFLAMEKELFARQGYIPSGWKALAARFGILVPGWVARHNLSGFAYLVDNSNFYGFKGVNGTNASMSLSVQRRIAVALNTQTNKMERQLAAWAARRRTP